MKKQLMREHMRERFGSTSSALINPPLPGSLNIELNNYCNHRCEFCGVHGKYRVIDLIPAELSLDFVKEIIDSAHELGIGQKELGFYLFGEPLLYKNLPEIIKYAKDKGFPYTFLTTNGSLAKPDLMTALVDSGLDSIRFSVNAADSAMYKSIHGRDDFDDVVNNIRYLDSYKKKKGVDIATSLSCVVCKKNQEGLIDGIRGLFSDIVDDILFIPVMLYRLNDIDEVKQSYQIQEETTEIDPDYNCSILFNTMYISSNGWVIPCCQAPYYNARLYDLNRKLDLVEAWYCEEYNRLRRIFLEKKDDKGTVCEDCILRRKGGANRFSYDKEL